MKKLFLSLAFIATAMFSFGQMIDEQNVTVTMDLQPVLQLQMDTPDQIDFVFDDIQSYFGGIIKYAATTLRVSSSVSWDLYVAGTSNNGTFWDNQVTYAGGGSPNAIDDLPLSLLELYQYQANRYDANATGTFSDYSNEFTAVQDFSASVASTGPGANSIYYSTSPYTAPDASEKYIQGHAGTVAGQDGAPGGSWLIAEPTPSQDFSDYYFTIDYRIVPGLPAIFPFAGQNDGTAEDLVNINGADSYAEPGVYTMNVKYILLQDQ